MIYSHKYRFAFIHVPRTGGTAITHALMSAAFPHATADIYELKHARAADLRPRVGGVCWREYYRFAVIRSPWEILASQYRLILQSARDLTWQTALHATSDWIAHLRRAARLSFSAYVETFYLAGTPALQPGGFWRTYCLGRAGAELGVDPIRFEDLPARWPEIVARCNLSPVDLPQINASDRSLPTPWTPELIAAVARLSYDDVERFGFQPPEVSRA